MEELLDQYINDPENIESLSKELPADPEMETQVVYE